MSPPKEVALCVTCLVDQVMPEIGVATVKLLRRAGYNVAFPTAQTCCGQPFFNSGFHQEATKLAIRMIEVFEPYEYVVLPSGSCTTMIRIEYPHLLANRPKWYYRALRLAQKTFELSQFLAQEADWQPAITNDAPASVTYHDSCHMCRLLHLRDEPRTLLTAVHANLQEMTQSDRCCGFGGLFSWQMPQLADAMTQAKLQKAQETAADILVTADPGCLMQLRRQEDNPMRTEHIATVLEEATR